MRSRWRGIEYVFELLEDGGDTRAYGNGLCWDSNPGLVAARLPCLMSIEILANPFSLQQLEQSVLAAVK